MMQKLVYGMKQNILIDLTGFKSNLGGLSKASLDLLAILNRSNNYNYYIIFHRKYKEHFVSYNNLQKIEINFPEFPKFSIILSDKMIYKLANVKSVAYFPYKL